MPLPHATCPVPYFDCRLLLQLRLRICRAWLPVSATRHTACPGLGLAWDLASPFSLFLSLCLCLFLYVSPGVDFVDFLALSSRIINWVDEQHLSVSKTLDYLAVPLTSLPLPPLYQALDICMYIHRTRETSPRFKMHLPLLFHDIFSYCWMGFLLQLAGDGTRCESVMWTATANLIMAVSQLFRLAQGRLIDTKT